MQDEKKEDKQVEKNDKEFFHSCQLEITKDKK